MMKFKCSGCGECCKHIDRSVGIINTSEDLKFPYKWDNSGRCEMLNEDNMCSIYNDRPLICNVEKLADHFNLNKVDFYQGNNTVCNSLMDESDIDLSYRV